MAGELQISHGVTGRTLYAVVRNSNALVWRDNAGAFEAFNAANWVDYDVILLEQGASGYYVGIFPVGITAAGAYPVEVRHQTGASPNVSPATDPVVGTALYQWSGSAVVHVATLLDLINGVEAGKTLRQALRLMAAALCGKRSNAGTTTETYDAIGSPGTARVVGNADADGNGTPTLTP